MFYILSREKNGAWSSGEEDFETYIEAKFNVECMEKIDKMNKEEWEYRIVEVERR